jgi:pimeloyl-ACP methyl ester carboxylesterase
MGVSLGGLAVLEALIEDARLHTHHFAAGISFSGVVNESGVTDSVLNTYGYRMRGSDGSKISGLASLLLDVPIFHFNDTRVHSGDSVTTKLTSDNAGQIFYQEFSKRLQNLAKNPSVMRTWNHAVKLTSVEEYVKTSSELVETSADKITVPVILIHAKNDPLVPYADFAAFAEREKNNSFIQTHATLIGGHWGYFSVFGVDWVTAMLKKLPGVE